MESPNEIPTEDLVKVDLQLLKDIHNMITVANQRCHWKISELYPLGLLVKSLEDTIERGEKDKKSREKLRENRT